METLAAMSAIMSLIGGGASIFGGLTGASKAKEAAAEDAKMEGIVTQAKVEDLRAEQRALEGQTIASAAGSGVRVDVGSPLDILKEQAKQFTREIQTVSRVGATRSANARTRGRLSAMQAKAQGFTQGINSFSNAFGIFSTIAPKKDGE